MIKKKYFRLRSYNVNCEKMGCTVVVLIIVTKMLVSAVYAEINPFGCGQAYLAPSPSFRNESAINSHQLAKEKILGGIVAVPFTWPWHGTLFENDVYICGGSLIDTFWFVTAAQCTRK